MDNKFEKKKEQMVSGEAARLRENAKEHEEALKNFWITFATTGVILIAIIILIICFGYAWFASNSRVSGASATISAAGQGEFSLATVGKKSQGVYDSIFGLSDILSTETIDGTEYHIASGNSSFRVDLDKDVNNYLANADLRPGNRGTFDLYVICRTDKREVVLRPVFSAWYESGAEDVKYKDAFLEEENTDRRIAAEFLKGHILLFANMDEKGMYSGNIDLSKEITINLSEKNASQAGRAPFPWGESVGTDGDTEVFRLPVYWVWPEQFGNFIYTGNSYNKNLFASKESSDYKYFLTAMKGDADYQKFFCIKGNIQRPDIDTIISASDFLTATKNYELYSGWYDAADEAISTSISYIELGFEIVEKN